MRVSFRVVLAGAAAFVVASQAVLGGSAASAQDASPTPAASPVGVTLVTTNGESLAQAFSEILAENGPQSVAARDLLANWAQALRPQQSRPGAGITGSMAKEILSGQFKNSPLAMAPAPSGAAFAAAVDANSFPVRGAPQGDRSYWSGNPMPALAADYCTPSGCKQTDKFTVKLTITPTRAKTVSGGSRGSAINWTGTYFPNGGKFKSIHMDAWGITSGWVMNESTPGSSGNYSSTRKSGTFYATNDRDLAGKRLTVAVKLWIDASSIGKGWLSDGAKTADCIGRTGSDVRCFY